jgi:ABC-type polysaccharide/polyol phosphate transport system ATPase subunit
MPNEIAVRVEGVSKRFRIYHQRNQTLKQTVLTGRRARYEELWALREVSFEIPRGTTFGIIGENGSGKSTLLKTIAGILKPDSGSIIVNGRLAALLELGAGFHPEYTGRENIYLNGALLGLPRKVIDRVFDEIVAFSELERFIDNPVKTYSSGMHARLGFAISVFVDPDILVLDEILAVGDMAFQRRCYDRLDEMKTQGKTMILVSHNLDAVRDHCRDCVWLDHGKIGAMGPVGEVIPTYVEAVRERELESMSRTVADVHREIPSGRGGVGITSVKFVGPGGEGHQFRTGEDFEVQIEYHSPGERLKGARLIAEFVREDGVVVFSTSSETGTEGIPGLGTARLGLPSLPLLEGLYRLGVTIEDAESQEPYTIIANAFPFRVEPNGPAGRGMVRLDHRWVLPA